MSARGIQKEIESNDVSLEISKVGDENPFGLPLHSAKLSEKNRQRDEVLEKIGQVVLKSNGSEEVVEQVIKDNFTNKQEENSIVTDLLQAAKRQSESETTELFKPMNTEVTNEDRERALTKMTQALIEGDQAELLHTLGFSRKEQLLTLPTVRYQKIKKMIKLKNLLQEEEKTQLVSFCARNDDDDHEEYAAGDVLEALESALAEKLFAQQKAVTNWAKIGLRIQMIQAFKMLDRMNESIDKEENTPFCTGFVIQKNSRSKMYWDIVNNFFLIASYFLVPYNIAFARPQPEDQTMRQLEILLDIIILIDIALSFVTDNYSEPGEKLTNWPIMKRYIGSYFIFDFLSCVPGLAMAEQQDGADWLFKLKLLRYLQIPRTFGQIDDQLTNNLGTQRTHYIQNLSTLINTVFKFLLIFHGFACVWIILGKCETRTDIFQCSEPGPLGWVSRDSGLADIPENLQETYIYVTALYFISTTATTVGYGDYGGKTFFEMCYLILVEFLGICIFSVITGQYQSLVRVPTIQQIVAFKTNDITLYLQSVDRAYQDDNLTPGIYDSTVEFIKKSYLYGVVQSLQRDNSFYRILSPELKNKLTFCLLETYYEKFFFFFNDMENQNFADDVFVRKVMSNLDCQIFIEGTEVVEYGKPFKDLYFNYKGSVTITDSTFQIQIAELPEQSFFGDYQIILGTVAKFHYLASLGRPSTWCMTISTEKFLVFCDEFPDFRAFLTVRGIQRRSHLKKIEQELWIRLGIKTKEQIQASKIQQNTNLSQVLNRQKSKMYNKIVKSTQLRLIESRMERESVRLNRKREREKFAPKSFHSLIDNELMKLDINELPVQGAFSTETVISYGIPVTRIFFIATSDKLRETRDLISKNLKLFIQFYNIFIRIKDHLNYESMKPELLKRQLQRYLYRKPTQESRGLRHVAVIHPAAGATSLDDNTVYETIQESSQLKETLSSGSEFLDGQSSEFDSNQSSEPDLKRSKTQPQHEHMTMGDRDQTTIVNNSYDRLDGGRDSLIKQTISPDLDNTIPFQASRQNNYRGDEVEHQIEALIDKVLTEDNDPAQVQELLALNDKDVQSNEYGMSIERTREADSVLKQSAFQHKKNSQPLISENPQLVNKNLAGKNKVTPMGRDRVYSQHIQNSSQLSLKRRTPLNRYESTNKVIEAQSDANSSMSEAQNAKSSLSKSKARKEVPESLKLHDLKAHQNFFDKITDVEKIIEEAKEKASVRESQRSALMKKE